MISKRLLALLGIAVTAAVACVPSDEALPTGSAEFTLFTKDDDLYLPVTRFVDRRRRWDVRIDRIRGSFKTVTIGQVGVPEQCSYRGRGALSNLIFDLSRGNTQTFNGIQPGLCPDVGIVFGAPDSATTLGAGMTVADLADMVVAPTSHVIIEGTATPRAAPGDDPTPPYRLLLRFDTARTTTTWGGCRDSESRRGVTIVPEQRQRADMLFRPQAIFREIIAPTANLRFEPLALADDDGNRDGIVTMDELDDITLASVRQIAGSQTYVLPDGVQAGSLGDYVRAQLRFVFQFNGAGICNGNPAGVE
ncbi:MAG: hypothetical protein JST00_35365 [Deltaproteobacteria bacterium]|nr:hypothetical protein [Deltaproteobacteria bacterium]